MSTRSPFTQTFPGQSRESGGETGAGETAPILERGVCLGRYLIVDLLGRGGMGEVYVAYDPELDRRIALKMLRGDGAAGREAQARLVREAQAAARLVHPHVVTVYDVGAVGDRIFIAMELVDGVDLAAWTKSSPRPWREVLRVFRDAGRGLRAAHATGLVHGDIKPGNLLVARSGRAVIVDFGLAREVELPADARAAAGAVEPGVPTLRMAGTPAYMAPEQLRGAAIDHRSDQFGFCAALYETLYGEPPFRGSSPAELLRAVEQEAVREAPPGSRVPAWLRRAVLRGLAADPLRRYADMDELLAALDRDPAVRRRRWLQAAAAAALAAAAVAGWSHLRLREELLCMGAGRKLAGIWDEARKADIRQALAAAGQARAAWAWPRVERLLDGYTREWTVVHTEACEATRLRGEQSESLLDLRMACLEARRQEIRAATDLLARADAQVALNAPSIARGLTGLTGCNDSRSLLAVAPPDGDPATRKALARIRSRLAESAALESAGKFTAALAQGERANRAAGELGYRPLLAEARLRLATAQGRAGQTDAMRETLLEAVELAQASRHDEALARALTTLIVASSVAGHPEDARLWGRLAQSVLERMGGHPDIAADRRFFLGLVSLQEHRAREAIEHFQAFLSLERSGRVRTKQSAHAAFLSLGIAHGELGQAAEARRYFERSLDEGLAAYGPEHPGVAATLCTLGEFHEAQRAPPAALEAFRRCLGTYERLRWPGREPSHALAGMGAALIDLDRAAEAVPLLERAVRLRAGSPEDPLHLALARFHLARGLWLAGGGGDRRRALLLADEARDALVPLGDRAREIRARVESWLATRPEAR